MDFFTSALAKEPTMAAILAEIQAAFGQASVATCLLARKLQECPMDTSMLIAHSKLLVEMGHPEIALKVHRYANGTLLEWCSFLMFMACYTLFCRCFLFNNFCFGLFLRLLFVCLMVLKL